MAISGLAPEIETGHETLPLPDLAFVAVVFVLCGLDGGSVVSRFDPFTRRNLAHPIEAIKPVGCHDSKPTFP